MAGDGVAKEDKAERENPVTAGELGGIVRVRRGGCKKGFSRGNGLGLCGCGWGGVDTEGLARNGVTRRWDCSERRFARREGLLGKEEPGRSKSLERENKERKMSGRG